MKIILLVFHVLLWTKQTVFFWTMQGHHTTASQDWSTTPSYTSIRLQDYKKCHAVNSSYWTCMTIVCGKRQLFCPLPFPVSSKVRMSPSRGGPWFVRHFLYSVLLCNGRYTLCILLLPSAILQPMSCFQLLVMHPTAICVIILYRIYHADSLGMYDLWALLCLTVMLFSTSIPRNSSTKT